MNEKAAFPREFEITEELIDVQRGSMVQADNPYRVLLRRFDDLDIAQDQAVRGLFLDLIEEVIDNMDKVLGTEQEEEREVSAAAKKYIRRFGRIRKSLEKVLAKWHVAEFDMENAPPGALQVLDAEGDERVVLKGWLYKGELLRKPVFLRS